jgi:hypothetical protein
LNVTFTLKQDSACVIFPGKDIMSQMLDKTKELVTMSAKDQDFEWIEALATCKHVLL